MEIFAPLKRAVARPTSSADLAATLTKAAAIGADLNKIVDEMTPRRDDILADEASRAKARRTVDETEAQLADLARFRTRLEDAHAIALAAEDQARRRAVYDAAAAKLGKPGAHRAAYEKAAHAVLASVRAMAAMSLEIAEANTALPAGARPLDDPFEAYALASRGLISMGLPREPLSERPMTLWCFADTWRPIGDQTHVIVSTRDGRRGYVSPNVDRPPGAISVAGNIDVELRSFLEVTSLPRTENQWAGPYTQTSLGLPGLYTPSTGTFAPTDAATIIAAIDSVIPNEMAKPPKRERQVELRPVTDDGEILEKVA